MFFRRLKVRLLCRVVVLVTALPQLAAPKRPEDRGDPLADKHAPGRSSALTRDFETYIDANKILMFVTNKGSFAYDNGVLLGKADGFYYPYAGLEYITTGANTTTAIYAASIWIGGGRCCLW